MKKILLFFVCVFCVNTFYAKVKLPRVFTDNAVLQREKPIAVWGWANSGEVITIEFAQNTYRALADESGKWRTEMLPQQAGGPFELKIKGEENEITLRNILIGDVWICSGQSNMKTRVNRINARDEELVTDANRMIRLFQPKELFSIDLKDDYNYAEKWKEANLENIKDFSATAYFFAKNLQPEIGVPIGLIQVSVGGSNIEAWIPEEDICQIPQQAEKFRKAVEKGLKVLKAENDERFRKWRENGSKPAEKPYQLTGNDIPSSLYNSQINPLLNLHPTGILWYQGESNSGKGLQYRNTFAMLINAWRRDFNDKTLPFIYVQLANYRAPCNAPCESTWAELREAQALTLELPETGMATAVDIGEANDIHPKNKQELGRRLALVARQVVYNQELLASGPVLKDATKKSGGILLTFNHVGNGLITRDNKDPEEFTIAAKNGDFVRAKARIEGENQIFVWSDEIKKPEYVRYAWADNPSLVNTYNSEKLPMLPFRTDNRNINREEEKMKKN
ncbi:MAG: sialate O-acetylesterase [Lentimicrobium sp.]|jgi:sialate O-acetylesterase|nr:sialate O-acetylesterase [Lentimicrobium sp.]